MPLIWQHMLLQKPYTPFRINVAFTDVQHIAMSSQMMAFELLADISPFPS